MKLRKLVILSGAIFVVVAATSTAQATHQEVPITVTKTKTVKATHMGLTAEQWHARAVWRTKQRNKAWKYRDELVKDTERLRTILRYEIQNVGSHPTERAFLCIHSYEGAWNDPNAPYYGGLQMDMSFQRAYGPEFLAAWGTADNWPISVQMAVAMRAYLSGRGYNPWPNTRRYCNLPG